MISCTIITSLLGCFITLFLFARHIYFLELPFWADICCIAAQMFFQEQISGGQQILKRLLPLPTTTNSKS